MECGSHPYLLMVCGSHAYLLMECSNEEDYISSVSWAADEQLCDVHLFEAQSSDTDEEYAEWSANFRRERQTRQRNKGVPMSACKLRPASPGPVAVCAADDLHCLEGIDDELESPRDLEADETADAPAAADTAIAAATVVVLVARKELPWLVLLFFWLCCCCCPKDVCCC